LLIGILGLQGDYFKHQEMLDTIDGVETRIVKMPDQLIDCSGLVIPGGESTTVGKLMERYGVDEAIKQKAFEGMAVFGTCMGMIILSKEIENSNQQRLGLIDMEVRRNAFGRQVDSYETDLSIDGIEGGPIRAVFIRAPYATRVWGDAEVLASLETGEILMVKQGKILAAAFHPELTNDTRVHEYFVEICRQ
jgi:pyridoxal 5'-phosphate synthase pdxT subunit